MKFGPSAIDEAEGAILAHSLTIGARRLPKGRLLTEADISLAREAGLGTLIVAKLDPDDIHEDAVATWIGRALEGPGVVARKASHGRLNLHAAHDGLFRLDPAVVDRFNLIDEAVTLATLPPLSPVQSGDVVATVKIIPYAVPRSVAEAVLAVGPADFSIAPFVPAEAGLIHTMLPGFNHALVEKGTTVMKARLAAVHGVLTREECCDHDEAAVAGLLEAMGHGPRMTLILGASATVDRDDVIPAAIRRAGGTLDRLGMPVDPGNLLCLGRIGEHVVVGLPGCARSPRRNGIDIVLERLFARLPVDGPVIAAMGVGGLLPETSLRPKRRVNRGGAVTDMQSPEQKRR